MAKSHVLVVGEDRSISEWLYRYLRRNGHELLVAHTAHEAAQCLRTEPVDLVIADLDSPNADVFDLLQRVRRTSEAAPVIVLAEIGGIDKAVEAIKQGAETFLVKPLDPQQLQQRVGHILAGRAQEQRSWRRPSTLAEELGGRPIIGRSQKIREILQLVHQVAPSNATVLIMGESGTGKELIAEAIHRHSRRSGGPLIKFSCASLAESIIESELFGHERGAFTGAVTQKKGLFEVANRGTIFLDEVGDMTPHTQARLLRVLQEGEFQRVGGTVTIKVDVRVIAATNSDLFSLVTEKRFRQDLYYRLNVVPIEIPALRERREDIPLLVEHFLDKYTRENHRPAMSISPKAMELLMRYDWPGNVRELENCIERCVVLSRTPVIEPSQLPPAILNHRDRGRIIIPVGVSMEEIKKEAILRTLEAASGNKTRAARMLGIGVRTIHAKLKEYGLQ